MMHLPASVRVYLCTSACDMRKSFDGLHALVAQSMELDAFAGHLFVFDWGSGYLREVFPANNYQTISLGLGNSAEDGTGPAGGFFGYGGIGADDESTFIELTRAGEKLFGFVFGFEETLGDGVKPAAEIGECGTAALAQDQLDAMCLLELADVIGNRRLRQGQFIGGA